MKPSHAGGVVYRMGATGIEYLLVEPSQEKRNEWLLPKGHIKEGETSENAAVREVREETGVTARVKCPIGTVEFKGGERTVRATFYLMELVSDGNPLEQRRHRWFSFEDAVKYATYPETKGLLRKAAARIET